MAKKPKDDTVPSFFEALYAARGADANEVAEGLFLGSAAAADDKKAMLKRRISHVLIVHPALPEKFPQHFRYHRAPILDAPEANMLERLPDALSFLGAARRGGGRPYVYCAKGVSRSASVVIALLMVERNIGFEEAFRLVEKERPIVYPNIGFQQQLRHLEALLDSGQVDRGASFELRVTQLRAAVPKGLLDGPNAPLRIREGVGDSMAEALEQLEALVGKVRSQPQLLQKRELWKRHGLFFENLHKYKALPGDPALLGRARRAAEALGSLPKIFSDTLQGVKLAMAVVKELDGWAAYAEPLLAVAAKVAEEPPTRAPAARVGGGAAYEEEEEDPAAAFLTKAGLDSSSSGSEGEGGGKKAKKKERKEKLSKKEKKRLKADKKVAKAARKAEKTAAKIAEAAEEAERLAVASHRTAEEAARRAEELEEELARQEAEEEEEELERRAAAAGARGDERRGEPGARGARSRSRSRRRGARALAE